jgi:ribonuclease HII
VKSAIRRTLGIDEAGRGPVLGPMVMAAVSLDSRGARVLSRAGVRDSKAFGASERAREERAALADKVRACALHVEVRVVDVAEIDRRVRRQELNVLEREVAEDMIACSPTVDSIIADGRHLFRPLASRHVNLLAWDGAEARHAAVAAASIVAKHRRDELFACIRRRYQPLFGEIRGGGYGNAATRHFLRAYAERFGRLPPEARRSWPYPYLTDILGAFDPYADIDDGNAVGQLSLL